MIKIEIRTESDAFYANRNIGVAEVLEYLAGKLRREEYPTAGGPFPPKLKREAHPLFDVNGNSVGWIWEAK